MRRTLVLVNGEWAMVNREEKYFIHHSQLTIHLPNVQVSDTTDDAMKTKACNKKYFELIIKNNVNR